MRLLFPGLLALSVGIVGTGLLEGSLARARAAEGEASGRPRRSDDGALPLAEAKVVAPVPVLPRYAEQVPAGGRLVWVLPPDTAGARVEMSRSPDFPRGQTRRADVDGETFRLPADLAPGPWYWRLRGRSEGLVGTHATPVWMLVVASPQGDWG